MLWHAAPGCHRFKGQTADHHDLHARQVLVALERFEHFNAVNTGHCQIGDEQIGLHARNIHHCLQSRWHPGAINRQIPGFELALVQIQCGFVILDHQHPQAVFRIDVDTCELRAVFGNVSVDGLQRNAAVPPQGFPRLNFSFFNQRLNRCDRQAQQAGGITCAAVIFTGKIGRNDSAFERFRFGQHRNTL